MGKIFTVVIMTLLVGLTCWANANGLYNYELNIAPVSDGDRYEMRNGEVVTFSVTTIAKDKSSGVIISRVVPEKVFWSFEYKYLKKVEGNGAEIKLMAVKPGACILKAVSLVKNIPLSKEITIEIKP